MPLGCPYRAEPELAFATQGVALGLTIQAFQAGGHYMRATSEREKMFKLQRQAGKPAPPSCRIAGLQIRNSGLEAAPTDADSARRALLSR